MGFGYLFVGYLFSFNTVAYPGFTKLISFLVMLLGVSRMAGYDKQLLRAYHALVATTFVGFLHFVLEAIALFSLLPATVETWLFHIIPLAEAISELFFLFFLLKGLQAIAKETEVPHLEATAFRNRIFTVVYYLLYAAGQLSFKTTPFLVYYNVALLFIGLVVTFLNAKLFYGYYMWICLPEDVEIKRKSSSIPWLEKLYRWLDERDEKSLKRRQEADAAYRKEKEDHAKRKKKENKK